MTDDTRIVAVRPFGWTESDPVVRRVRDGLAIGNEHAASEPTDAFDAVVSLTADPRPATTHHHPLVDGPEATYARFAAAVETVRDRLATGDRVLVHCRAGVSRSSAVTATALAFAENRPFRDALADVQTARPVAVPHPRLHELGVISLAAERTPTS